MSRRILAREREAGRLPRRGRRAAWRRGAGPAAARRVAADARGRAEVAHFDSQLATAARLAAAPRRRGARVASAEDTYALAMRLTRMTAEQLREAATSNPQVAEIVGLGYNARP